MNMVSLVIILSVRLVVGLSNIVLLKLSGWSWLSG